MKKLKRFISVYSPIRTVHIRLYDLRKYNQQLRDDVYRLTIDKRFRKFHTRKNKFIALVDIDAGWFWINSARAVVTFIKYNPFPRTVYASQFSRDCDMYESYGRDTFPSLWHFHRAYMNACKWAEGPVSWQIISKEEYEELETGHRDRTMEAYENGRGNSIYV